jgi:hypothetical protein
VVVRPPSERRPLMSVDALGYGSADGERQAGIQEVLISVLTASAASAGLDRAEWDCQKAGDGEFAVLPSSTSEKVLIDDFVRHLAGHLGTVNRDRKDASRIRLRLAIHHGVVQQAANGYAGAGAVVVNRLVESAPAKAAQRAARDADLVVIVSNEIFMDTIAQGFALLRPKQFRRADVRVKEYVATAWLYVPGADITTLDLDLEPEPDLELASPRRRSVDALQTVHQSAEVISNFHGPVQADVIGIKKG